MGDNHLSPQTQCMWESSQESVGIMSGKGGSGINPGMLGGIFKSAMDGGDQGDDDKGNPK